MQKKKEYLNTAESPVTEVSMISPNTFLFLGPFWDMENFHVLLYRKALITLDMRSWQFELQKIKD